MTETTSNEEPLKLFMVLLGSKAPGRHVEQHDFFFGIATSLKQLVPDIQAFWREAGSSIHIDGWREVNMVDGYAVKVVATDFFDESSEAKKLFFVNLGGYQANRFEEQHYVVLTVTENRAEAFKTAKQTFFYKHNHIEGAGSHIDDSYGIDVDDLYQIEDVLSDAHKQKYRILLFPDADLPEDPIHLGYFRLDKL